LTDEVRDADRPGGRSTLVRAQSTEQPKSDEKTTRIVGIPSSTENSGYSRPQNSVNTIRALDVGAGLGYSREEWLRRFTPHIDPPLSGLSVEEQLRQKIAKLEARIIELEREKLQHDEILGGLDQIEGVRK